MSATPATMLKVVCGGLQDRERLQPPRGQPNMAAYRRVLRERTRFAIQWQRVDFDNLADFGKRATVTLPVRGELITRATLVVQLPDLAGLMFEAFQNNGARQPIWYWTNSTGNALCANMQFIINDQVVDELDSRLLEIDDEQHGPVEHWDTTNNLLNRDPSEYPLNSSTTAFQVYNNQTLEVVPPFWWNRGVGPQALPIQALYRDKVQITVNFRPVQECVFTTTKPSALLPAEGRGALPIFPGSPFLDGSGNLIPNFRFPTEWHFEDAYWIVEYISLEDREAAAFRMADLQIPILQHVPISPRTTQGETKIRLPIPQAGLIRDMTWVAQRTEAPNYNAWFLFSRDLGTYDASGNLTIWWPNAQIPDYNYSDGYGRPAFVDRQSDPIAAASLYYRGKTRFEHEGPSMFRSLIPALNCQRTPLIDRYIYRYDFGFWPSGGLMEALDMPDDEVRGAANWDMLPKRELVLHMNNDLCTASEWVTAGSTVVYGPAATLIGVGNPSVDGFYIDLSGACPIDGSGNDVSGGFGATVTGYIDYRQIQAIPMFAELMVRVVPNGSASLVVRKTDGSYEWIAVAAGGGVGSPTTRGGNAGNAVYSGFQGGNGSRTHAVGGGGQLGGGGGGRAGNGAAEPPGPGQNGGIQMPTAGAAVFVTTLATTGGTTSACAGGDGYYGGGSGTLAGGGGGSYVSDYVTRVSSKTLTTSTRAMARLTPVRRQAVRPPSFDIYMWLTRYNMLRITAGHGALMFVS